MKLKNKIIVLLLIIFAILLVAPSVVNAATTVQYTRTIPSNDGTIKLNFSGLELDATKAYEFALVEQGDEPESWNRLDAGYTDTTATITLNPQTAAIRDVLKVADIGYIYIREKDDTSGTYELEANQVNLKLPYLQSLAYIDAGGKYNLAAQLYGESIGDKYSNIGSNTTYTRWEKVTSEEIVEAFLNIKNNNAEISGLENYLPEPPQTGWVLEKASAYSDKNDGLYLLWVKRTGTKDVYSCIVHDGLPEATTVEQYIQIGDEEAPTMENLRIEFSSSFVYDDSTGYQYVAPGTTITIKATFNEVIYGNTAPTLKIRCGNGEEITVPAGTITGQYILYNYTIKEQDKGIIAAVSMTGGDIKDENGNTVTSYTCPTLYTNWMAALATNKIVYANGSGMVTEPDDEQENTNQITIIRGNNNQFIRFPSSLTRSWMKNWDGHYVYSGTIEKVTTSGTITFQIQYAGIKDEKVAEIQAQSDITENDDEFNTWLNNYVKANYINEENWENFTNMKIDLECILDDEPHEHLVFVKVIDGDNEYIVWQGYGEGFSRVLSTRVDLEDEQQPNEDNTPETDNKQDNTTANKELPKTGKFTLISILMLTSVIGVVSYIKTKKYKGI